MTRLLIDLSSVLRAAHYAGKDMEFGRGVTFNGKPIWVNSAQWAFDTFMAGYANLLAQFEITPVDTIIVKDGMDSRYVRKNIYPQYKANRPASAPELNEEYAKAITMVCDAVMSFGGAVIYQDYMEADDVIAHLSQKLQGRKLIWSRDADMLALMNRDVDVYLKDVLNPPIHESCPAEFIHVFKALVGDSSDNLPGAKGFGPGAFKDLVLTFKLEGLQALRELLETNSLHELKDDVPELKSLQKVIDSAGVVYLCYACAKFFPDRVNTNYHPLTIEMRIPGSVAGAQVPSRLRDFASTKTLVSPTDAKNIGWLQQQLKLSPAVALDIETATPPESDLWVAGIKETKKGAGKSSKLVDVEGSFLVGLSLTFGKNMQHTVYLPVRHKDSENWHTDSVASLIGAIPDDVPVLIHNASFELPVLYNEWGGWVENVVDTSVLKSYVDENTPLGLKFCSEHYFGHAQTNYDEVTTIDGVQYKMNELTAKHVFDYACDDTICTAALWNRLRLTAEIEGTLDVYMKVDQPTHYWVAEMFAEGVDADFELLEQFSREDAETYEQNRKVVVEYLRDFDWPGTKLEPFEATPAGIKAAFQIVVGEPLVTRVRKLEKLLEEVSAQGAPELAELIASGSAADVQALLEEHFDAEPQFDPHKSAHMQALFYDIMKLPVRFRTRVTPLQREKGKREGTPQVDKFAVEHALQLDLDPESDEYTVLKAVRKMLECQTREGLYYRPYPALRHWKTGKIHASMGQARTATRRFAPNNPNLNQLPKKGEGIKVRQAIAAPPGFLVVSMDFSGQELRLAAEDSGDAALTSCYIGENLRDPHSLTGHGIAQKQLGYAGTYEEYEAERRTDELLSLTRAQGKGVNFSSQYLCRAPKLAKLLTCEEKDAQAFLDAKNEVYSGLVDWQQEKIQEAHQLGYALTFLGARRHLWGKLSSSDKYLVMEAERQAVNFRIQGSGGEMMKLAATAAHKAGLFPTGDCKLLFPVHDELDFLVRESEVYRLVPALHSCMIQKYAGMQIPLESEISIGYDFGNLVKVGKTAPEGAITRALEKLHEQSKRQV